MRQQQLTDLASDLKISNFDYVIEALIIILLSFMPLAFGAVQPFSELVVIIVTGLMVLVLLLRFTFRCDIRMRWSWAYLPVALFILLVVVQLRPLSLEKMNVISGNTVAVKTTLLNDLGQSSDILNSVTLSFYPCATKGGLRLLMAAAVIFFVVVNVYRRSSQIKRLLRALAVIGGVVALIALAQDFVGNGKIYWLVPTGNGKAGAGTFVNHSHFGQFMNLSIGAALGLLLVKLHESFRHKKITLPGVLSRLSQSDIKKVWYLCAMIIIAAVTVFVSLTRGGIISMLIAGAVTSVMLTFNRRRKGRAGIIVTLAFAVFICVLYIGFDAVYDRLATLGQVQRYKDRWNVTRNLVPLIKKFPLFGTGLGTHEVVYPMYEQSPITALSTHAENEYAQVLEETGLVGFSFLMFFGFIIGRNYLRNIGHNHPAMRSAAFGLGFGLLAVLIHSLCDFGQHLPGNFSLSMVFCALLIALARLGHKGIPGNTSAKKFSTFSPIGAAATVIVIIVWLWPVVGAINAYRADRNWQKALKIESQIKEAQSAGSFTDYRRLIRHLSEAASYEGDNIKYRHWLNVYHWRRIRQMADSGAISENYRDEMRQTAKNFDRGRMLCPTYGPTYCVLGQIEHYFLGDPDGRRHIRKAFELAPGDPTACFAAALLDVQESRFEESVEKFRWYVELDGAFKNVTDLYVNKLERPDLAYAVADGNISRLLFLVEVLARTGRYQDLAAKARYQAFAMLENLCDQPNAPAWALASMADVFREQKDYQSAIKYYRKALALNYGQVYWRFLLARTLADTNQASQAIHEAQVCLRLQPEMAAAKKLVEKLDVGNESMP